MIYGDQSQEGFLLRDYFCGDTNEPRLQSRCRPITSEGEEAASLLRSNNQDSFVVFAPCPNLRVAPEVAHVENMARRAIVCLAVPLLVCIVDLSLLHCVARVLHSAASLAAPICHLCICQIGVPCVRDL